jgi:2-polyprenyl-3-methyl-5-hydroxy-6-metoxy-1,4-benzoquinol methylase
MSYLAKALATAAIRASQFTPFRGRGTAYAVGEEQTASTDPRVRFAQGFTESGVVGQFYDFFPELPTALEGKDVLDFGCAYGGKAVEFAKHAKSVSAIEPFPHVIELAQAYARHLGTANVEFQVCSQDSIPYRDESFDIVLSHDVIEHVDDPSGSLREIERVLKPGGKAYVVFPPYDGMFSHHLDYATLLPGLHWLFAAETLVDVVNTLPTGMAEQPKPLPSWDKRRKVLPWLNGLTGPQFHKLAEAFADAHIEYHLVGHDRGRFARTVSRAVLAPLAKVGLRDRMTQSIAAVLTKGDPLPASESAPLERAA